MQIVVNHQYKVNYNMGKVVLQTNIPKIMSLRLNILVTLYLLNIVIMNLRASEAFGPSFAHDQSIFLLPDRASWVRPNLLGSSYARRNHLWFYAKLKLYFIVKQ